MRKNLRSCPAERFSQKSKNREGTDKENVPVNSFVKHQTDSKKNEKTKSSKKTNVKKYPLVSSSNTEGIQLVEDKILAPLQQNENIPERALKRRIASHDDSQVKSGCFVKENSPKLINLKHAAEKPKDLPIVDECKQIVKSVELQKKGTDCDHKNVVSQERNKRKLRSSLSQKRIEKHPLLENKSDISDIKLNMKRRVKTKENKKEVPVAPAKKPKTSAEKDSSINTKDNILKKCKKPIGKIFSDVNWVNNTSQNRTDDKNRSTQEKCVKTGVYKMKKTNNIPIYKKDLNVTANKSIRRRKKVDVYDMDLDEDLIKSSEEEIKRKKNCLINKGKKKRNQSKKKMSCVKSSTLAKTKSKLITKPIVTDAKITGNETGSKKTDESVINTNLTEGIAVDNNITAVSKPIENEVELVPDQNVACADSINLESGTAENSYLVENNTDSDPHIFAVPSAVYLSNNPKGSSGKYLSILADELERSFMMPTLTSTPFVHPKKGLKIQKRKVIDVSKIPHVNRNCLNTTDITPDLPVNEDTHLADEIDKDITLFESPSKLEKEKEEGKKCKSPTKKLHLNLFEFFNSPAKPVDLNESVVQPKKAYHTPDNFKTHLIRTKRTAAQKREVKKSKTDILIEKMSQHFDEIESLEFCVE